MTTINTLISDSLIDLGRLSPSDTIDANDLTHGLRAANRLFGYWAIQNLLIPYTTSESFTLTASTSSYTMGSGGTASSTRALKLIDSCYLRDSDSFDYPLTLITQDQFNSIENKSLGGRPDYIYYDPLYPLGYIYFYKTPDSAYTAYIESIKYLHDTVSSGTTIALSKEYEHFVVVSLRNYLAGSFGVQLTQRQEREEIEVKEVLKSFNLSNRMVTMNLPPEFGGAGKRYSIEEG